MILIVQYSAFNTSIQVLYKYHILVSICVYIYIDTIFNISSINYVLNHRSKYFHINIITTSFQYQLHPKSRVFNITKIGTLWKTNTTMENHHAINGKTHYTWAIFNSYFDITRG